MEIRADGTYNVPPAFPDAKGVLLNALMLAKVVIAEGLLKIRTVNFESPLKQPPAIVLTGPKSHFVRPVFPERHCPVPVFIELRFGKTIVVSHVKYRIAPR